MECGLAGSRFNIGSGWHLPITFYYENVVIILATESQIACRRATRFPIPCRRPPNCFRGRVAWRTAAGSLFRPKCCSQCTFRLSKNAKQLMFTHVLLWWLIATLPRSRALRAGRERDMAYRRPG